jgi:hypothetical protein
MSKYKYKLVLISGMKEIELDEREADAFRIYRDDGQWIEIHPRRTDGRIAVTAKQRLRIHPVGSNWADVDSVEYD